jgi:predicted RND superfamily exporter protein
MSHRIESPRLHRLLRPAAIVVMLLALAAVPFASRVSIDNRMERWIDPDSTAAADYGRFKEEFGNDEFLIIAYSGGAPFEPAELKRQLDVLERLEELPQIAAVLGIPSVYRDIFDEQHPEALQREFEGTPFYRNFLISEDGTVAGLWVDTALPEGARARRDLMLAIHEAVEPLQEGGWTVHIVGPPALNAALDETSERESLRTFPVALVLSVAVLLALLRCWRATLVAVSCSGLAILLTIGLMGLTGRPLNMVTSVLPSLLWVMALAGIVHILRRYQAHRAEGASIETALERSLGETALPCALSSLTTCLGFLSLLAALMAPVRELGAFAAAGLLTSLLVNLTVGPELVRWLRVPAPRRMRSDARWTDAAARLSVRHSRRVWSTAALFIAAALPSLGWIALESDPLTFLPDDSATVQSYRAVSDELTGYYSLELVVRAPGGWLDDSYWEPLERLAVRLEAQAGIARVLSPLDLLKKLAQWRHGSASSRYALPESSEEAKSLLGELGGAIRGDLDRLVSEDGETLRLSALVDVMPSSRFMVLKDAADAAILALPDPLTGFATGIVLQLVDAQLTLIDTQLRSFGIAFCTVFLCLLIGLRSWRLTAVAIVPNLLPILAAFTVMAALGVPLDPATVMMASVALGIAVDDSVHVLISYRRERGGGRSAAEAVRVAMAQVGPAMVITTIAACIGFFALMRSAFVPIQLFGLLSGIAMIAALAADVLLLPAILIATDGQREETG